MSLFKKKSEEIGPEQLNLEDLPELPELPELPDLDRLNKLPSLPNNSFGRKFSQDTIKEAITGEKEDEIFDEDKFEENQMTQKPLRTPITYELPMHERRFPEGFEKAARVVRNAEQIFVRIDKFEESLETFEKAKEKLSEIERDLREIRVVKEKEQQELEFWENEIKNIKNKIEKANRDLFSKIE